MNSVLIRRRGADGGARDGDGVGEEELQPRANAGGGGAPRVEGGSLNSFHSGHEVRIGGESGGPLWTRPVTRRHAGRGAEEGVANVPPNALTGNKTIAEGVRTLATNHHRRFSSRSSLPTIDDKLIAILSRFSSIKRN